MFKTLQSLVLASGSPRRRRMLAELGLEFAVVPADIPELAAAGEEPADFVRRLAGEKAAAVAALHPGSWILAADTVVVLAGKMLGKPGDPEEAMRMLAALSGRRHTVFSGFCLLAGAGDRAEAAGAGAVIGGVAATEVIFADLSPELIAAYVATGEPLDKAGAYGIQDRGGVLVQKISGSPSNVIGLPLNEVINALLAAGVISL